ncbi:IS3 family transposase [Fibrobacter sp. UWH1]|uniref:IS3 family transposase n=1 Tax=Fibrobacter sp. UWH1 TaxID=1964354 RepID=UPI0011314172
MYEYRKQNNLPTYEEERRQREADLVQTVRSVFEEYFCIYGCTKFLRELNDRSVDINEYKLRRIMRETGQERRDVCAELATT